MLNYYQRDGIYSKSTQKVEADPSGRDISPTYIDEFQKFKDRFYTLERRPKELASFVSKFIDFHDQPDKRDFVFNVLSWYAEKMISSKYLEVCPEFIHQFIVYVPSFKISLIFAGIKRRSCYPC